ncbi:MarR family winged helix-turn-helix transcriptional regulator [Pseudovibrio sp. SPO723]|uniref:MarR family winged helix-turn-helix transcriptional regulator n=1 Tax=Nesiotobacter zosterae TaxID=392721 RepID=UPI0029C5E5DE|nr:MarR family transcriptional regulator [Pseudovibrio sp. SPO723]MDX5592275.1 MarR family transcriptional regulator [Pseudovibrio sp. SPO723]
MLVDQVANKLTAVSTLLEDTSVETYGDLSSSAVAALLTIQRNSTVSIGGIATEVRLSHSATVRLIDRLEKDWLVRRQRRRGREVMVELTARGKRRASDLAKSRWDTATALLKEIDEKDLERLDAVFQSILDKAENSTCMRYCFTDMEPVAEPA